MTPAAASDRVDEPTDLVHVGPARLLQLPYELIEYTVEEFFTQGEAAHLITLNRAFFQLFSKKTWHKISLDGITLVGEWLPLEVLGRYGSHVRDLYIETYNPEADVSALFPHVAVLNFYMTDYFVEMFTVHLERMRNLQKLTLDVVPESGDAVDPAVEWINDVNRSAHVRSIVIVFGLEEDEWPEVYLITESLLTRIADKTRISINCDAIEPFPAQMAHHLPLMLSRLDASEYIASACLNRINKQLFGSPERTIYSNLRVLGIQPCCNRPGLYNFSSFTPDRFPVLRTLCVAIPKQPCDESSSHPLMTIFSRPWLTVTSFLFYGNEASVPEISGILRSMPNLIDAELYNTGFPEIDGKALPRRLQTLTFGSCEFDPTSMIGHMQFVTRLNYSGLIFDEVDFEFFASCPRLAQIEFTDCGVEDPEGDWVKTCARSSVRKITIKEEFDNGEIPSGFECALGLFPNLKTVDIRKITASRQKMYTKLQSQLQSQINIIT
ncbi:hypothetical protein GQ42DRAFT_164854 [Ramicandelaber brevisporus]|nr:hypothetical protein GQ42DRAFT_164854 [Ramicandelaber brevisporus]